MVVSVLGLFSVSAQAAVVFTFDTGDGVTPSLDGWTIIAQSTGAQNVPYLQVDGSERNRINTDPVLGTAWDIDGEGGGFRGDNAHDPLIARSPSFFINEAGNITWSDAGGNNGTAPVGTAGSYGAGAQGLALVRESDGVVIASVAANQTPVIDVGALGLLNDGNAYFLEAVDTRSGGWGYVEWDNISVPGSLVPEPSSALLGLVGGLLLLRRRR